MLISLVFTINTHTYHQARFFNSSNRFSGSIYTAFTDLGSYFTLRKENQLLLEENRQLRSQLFNHRPKDSVPGDTLLSKEYEVVVARVIKNSYAAPMNYLTLDKGKRDSVAQDMGVITPRGILGIIENTSKRYSTVQSILNTNSNINAKLKGTDYFGSLIWNGEHYNTVQLMDIPRLVPLHVGDTIVTGAMSSIFPEGIPIGTIKKFDLKGAKSFYDIDVELFNDMANLGSVYIIKNNHRTEIQELQAETKNDQ